MAPLRLTISTAATLWNEAVLHNLGLVEVWAEGVVTGLVQGQLLDDLTEGATVLGIPGCSVQLFNRHAGLVQHVLVVDHCNGVPVLWQTVALAVATPKVGQTGQVLVGVDTIALDE